MSNNRLLTIEGTESCEWLRPNEFKGLVLKKPIVLINGAFDLLHPGHLRLIQQAKFRAGTLVCALDADLKIRESKGPGRPIMSWVERATSLGYVGVDYVVEITSEKDMADTIKHLQPTFRIQGAEYTDKPTHFPQIKRMFIRCWGKTSAKIGTTDIIRRCQMVWLEPRMKI